MQEYPKLQLKKLEHVTNQTCMSATSTSIITSERVRATNACALATSAVSIWLGGWPDPQCT